MPVNIHRVISCPICQTQITIKLIGFEGKMQLVCNRCDCSMINWTAHELENAQKNKNFTKTDSNPRMERPNTAQRLPIQNDPNKQNIESKNELRDIPVQPKSELPVQSKSELPVQSKNELPVQPKNIQTQNKPDKDVIKRTGPFSLQQNKLERIGDYRILNAINSGSMGEIFLAQHVGMKNLAAIKLLSPKMEKDPHASERFKQEARVHSRLEHPNIVKIFDVDSYNNRPYIVMEYIEGQSLAQVLNNRKFLLPKHALKIAMAVAHALEHALKQKIIHRDLKPANIMIDKKNRKVKLADFGLGKILEEKGATVTGQMMGTAYYMAPEQVYSAKEVDHRADIYSLGATIYHMLSGQPPYAKVKGALDILKAKINEDPEPLELFSRQISKNVSQMVAKAMSRNVENRYKNPTEMIQEIEKTLLDL